MFIPVRTDCPLRSTPYVNYALIFANVVIFALQEFARRGAGAGGVGGAGLLGIDFNALTLDPGDPKLFHFVTYAFLHGGWMHLIGNMVFLYIFGNNVSDKLGQWAYLAFYLAGGIFAGVGFVLTAEPIRDGLYAPVLGASGAVAAVTGAYLVLFPRSRVTIFYFFILIGVWEIPGLWFVLVFFLQDVFLEVFGASSGVAHTAHISGTVFGVTISLALLGLKLIERDQFDLASLITRWNRRRQYRAAVATGWNPYGVLPPALPERTRRQAPPDPREQMVMELRAQVAEAMAHRNLPAAVEHYLRLRSVDPGQVLSRNAQLDIANQLAEMGRFAQAAEAYEQFLKHYPQSEQHAHIELLTGILYARYLDDPAKAVARIEHALPRLTTNRDIELARTELGRLKPVGQGRE